MQVHVIKLEDYREHDIPKDKIQLEAVKIEKPHKLKQNERWFDKFNKKSKKR